MPVCRRHIDMYDSNDDGDFIIAYWCLRYRNKNHKVNTPIHDFIVAFVSFVLFDTHTLTYVLYSCLSYPEIHGV